MICILLEKIARGQEIYHPPSQYKFWFADQRVPTFEIYKETIFLGGVGLFGEWGYLVNDYKKLNILSHMEAIDLKIKT